MRLVFAGTPAFAATALEALIAAGHEIVLVMTQPDRPSGRGLASHPTPVKAVALEHGIAVTQPKGLRLDGRHAADAAMAHERLHALPHDAMVVAAYGLILPRSVLTIPRLGCLNIHASLLPRWRGAAPIQRAIEAGDRETGITIMQMDEGLDTGDILSMRAVAIAPSESAGSLTDTLASLGGEAIVEALDRLGRHALPSRPQHEPGDETRVTYAAKLSKSESRVDFAIAAEALVDRIRAFDPWPGCTAVLHDGATAVAAPFRIWRAEVLSLDRSAAMPGPLPDPLQGRFPGQVLGLDQSSGGVIVSTGDGPIVLTELQKPGGRRLPARSFAQDFTGRHAIRFEPE